MKKATSDDQRSDAEDVRIEPIRRPCGGCESRPDRWFRFAVGVPPRASCVQQRRQANPAQSTIHKRGEQFPHGWEKCGGRGTDRPSSVGLRGRGVVSRSRRHEASQFPAPGKVLGVCNFAHGATNGAENSRGPGAMPRAESARCRRNAEWTMTSKCDSPGFRELNSKRKPRNSAVLAEGGGDEAEIEGEDHSLGQRGKPGHGKNPPNVRYTTSDSCFRRTGRLVDGAVSEVAEEGCRPGAGWSKQGRGKAMGVTVPRHR